MAYKMEDALLRYVNRDCTVFTVDEEFYGVLTEVGEGFILVSEEGTDAIINISKIVGVQFDEE
mgnify:FL=1